jgi:hypothetical protein
MSFCLGSSIPSIIGRGTGKQAVVGWAIGSLSKEKTRDVQNAKETLKTHYNIKL